MTTRERGLSHDAVKSEVISVRCSAAEKAEIAAWAAAHHRTTSEAMLTAWRVLAMLQSREEADSGRT